MLSDASVPQGGAPSWLMVTLAVLAVVLAATGPVLRDLVSWLVRRRSIGQSSTQPFTPSRLVLGATATGASTFLRGSDSPTDGVIQARSDRRPIRRRKARDRPMAVLSAVVVLLAARTYTAYVAYVSYLGYRPADGFISASQALLEPIVVASITLSCIAWTSSIRRLWIPLALFAGLMIILECAAPGGDYGDAFLLWGFHVSGSEAAVVFPALAYASAAHRWPAGQRSVLVMACGYFSAILCLVADNLPMALMSIVVAVMLAWGPSLTRLMLVLTTPVLVIMAVVVFEYPHRVMNRWSAWNDPASDPFGLGWQRHRILDALWDSRVIGPFAPRIGNLREFWTLEAVPTISLSLGLAFAVVYIALTFWVARALTSKRRWRSNYARSAGVLIAVFAGMHVAILLGVVPILGVAMPFSAANMTTGLMLGLCLTSITALDVGLSETVTFDAGWLIGWWGRIRALVMDEPGLPDAGRAAAGADQDPFE